METELFLQKGLKVLFELSVILRKSIIFKFETISIRKPSNLNVLIIFFCILEVLGPLLFGVKIIPSPR